MLIRFTVTNFRSFREEAELSMIPGKGRIHSHHVITTGKPYSLKSLRAAALYGANASGKSNLLRAVAFAQQTIVEGQRPQARISVQRFKFDAESRKAPASFQFEFRHKSKNYIYGFSVDPDRIHEEWLYELRGETEKAIFERKTNNQGETFINFEHLKLDREASDLLKFTAMGTPANQLFLTDSIHRNIKEFEDVYAWFRDVLLVIFPESRHHTLTLDFISDEDFRHRLQDFLQSFDTGIVGVRLKDVSIARERQIPSEIKKLISETMPAEFTEADVGILQGFPTGNYVIRKLDEELKVSKLVAMHKMNNPDGKSAELQIQDESDGTQRLFDLIPLLIRLLKDEVVILIDELDRSLHPHLSYKLLELFLQGEKTNTSQLIVTTHESGLLDLDLLRRDEIWFVEKDPTGNSTLYSLEEFAPRYDKDIRKGYLLGRFGAVPVMRNINRLKWVK